MKKVLLIEDDPWLAASYARTLADFDVAVAHTPLQAVAQLDAALPAVIVCDVMLQEGNAFDVIGLLAGYDDTQAIPVILLSTVMKNLASSMADYGLFATLDKTDLTPERLRQTVEAACAH